MTQLNMKSKCQESMPYYYDYMMGILEQIPGPITAHIADCPDCQNEIQWLKEANTETETLSLETLQSLSLTSQMQLHRELMDQPVRCSTIKSFLPILAIPELTVRISTPVTEHIHACSECAHDLETLKQSGLSKEELIGLGEIFSQTNAGNSSTAAFAQDDTESLQAIRRIMNRPDSGVVTCFRTEDVSMPSKVLSFNVDTNSGHHNSETQSVAVKRRSKWVLKPIAAAAAVIIGALFLFQSPSVKATDIGQIYEALKNIQNVMMVNYDVNISEPVQQIWISHSLGIKLLETNGAFTLYDIKNKIKKSIQDPAANVVPADIDSNTANTIAGTMDVPWGLLPFKNSKQLPEGAVWEKVPAKNSDFAAPKVEIYDLFWTQKATQSNISVDYQWRCHVDPATKRPFKIEWWQKKQSSPSYELTTFCEITYPTQDQVLHIIKQAGL